MIQRIKALWAKARLWWAFLSEEDEENLFIDVLYTKGVEDYAFNGVKNEEMYEHSKHYRLAWDHIESYQNEINPKGRVETLGFLGEYVTGVACAYIHGELFYAEQVAQDILSGKKRDDIIEHARKDGKFYASQFRSTPVHMKKGFDNAMVVMNKQAELLKTDTRTQRIKEIHSEAKKKFGKASMYKVGEIEKLAQPEQVEGWNAKA